MTIIEVRKFSDKIHQSIQYLVSLLVPKEEYSEVPIQLLKDLIKAESSHLFLAMNETDQIMGMLTLGFYYSPTGKKATIEDVVVDPKFRQQGVGKSLTEYAINFARTTKAKSLMLTSRPSRVAANQLYQKLNFKQKETNVYRVDF